jgi:hypothetical protein
MRKLRSLFNGNDEKMGGTFFGEAVAGDAPRSAAPQQLRTDRGIDGRAGGSA